MGAMDYGLGRRARGAILRDAHVFERGRPRSNFARLRANFRAVRSCRPLPLGRHVTNPVHEEGKIRLCYRYVTPARLVIT
jgi:hypothetical protein